MSGRRGGYGTMLEVEEAESRLREHGSRFTAQRRAVLEILSGNRTHPTADELVSAVRDRLGCVSPATIYNTLETLEELGFVRRIDGLESSAHFDPDTSDHQHAICTMCRKVWDVGETPPPPDLPKSFEVTDVLFQGICGDCARR